MGKKEGVFRFADRVDKLLMMAGALGSIGDGMQVPLMMFVLSSVINDYGKLNADVSYSVVNKVHKPDSEQFSLRQQLLTLLVFCLIEFSECCVEAKPR